MRKLIEFLVKDVLLMSFCTVRLNTRSTFWKVKVSVTLESTHFSCVFALKVD